MSIALPALVYDDEDLLDCIHVSSASGPFGDHAVELYQRGWHPIPTDPTSGTKKPSRKGDTGRDGSDYSEDELVKLALSHAHHGLGIRLPEGMIGIDVDQRDGKVGSENLEAFRAERDLPELPLSVFVTAREWPSGILLYRVPLGIDFNDAAIADVDIIQRHHRFVQGPGSIHPRTGSVYRALDTSTGEVLEVLPHTDEIPDMPYEWVQALQKTAVRVGTREPIQWENPNRRKPMSRAVKNALKQHWSSSYARGRHPALMAALGALVRIDSKRGHGTSLAIDQVEAEFIAAVTGDGSRTEAEAQQEFQAAYAYCIRGVASTLSTLDGDGIIELEEETVESALHIPQAFWNAREGLRAIREYAHASRVGCDPFLGAVLARVSANTAHNVVVQTQPGRGPTSINYAVAIVGRTGVGKTSSVKAARRAIPGPSINIDNAPPSSAEGMVEAYMGNRKEPGDDGKTRSIRTQTKFSALFYADEGEEFVTRAGREGATVWSTVRTLWNGESTGSYNATAERTRHIDENRYRWAMIMGFQDGKADQILADDVGGTPQRILWLRAEDPLFPLEPPDLKPLAYNGLRDVPAELAPLKDGFLHLAAMGFPAEIAAELDRQSALRIQGKLGEDDEESQGVVLAIKTAALLALLDNRNNVIEEDWRLARMVVETSNAVRRQAVAAAQRKADENRRRAAEMDGERQVIAARKAQSLHDERLERLARALARTLDKKGALKRKQLRNSLSGRERSEFDDAAEFGVASDWIEFDNSEYRVGSRIAEVRS